MVCTIRKKFGRSVGENALQKMILWREAEKIRQGVKLIGLEKSTIMKLCFFCPDSWLANIIKILTIS